MTTDKNRSALEIFQDGLVEINNGSTRYYIFNDDEFVKIREALTPPAVAAQGVTETMTVKQFISQIGGAFCPCDNDPRSHGDVLFRRYPNGVTIVPDKAATAPNACADKGE